MVGGPTEQSLSVHPSGLQQASDRAPFFVARFANGRFDIKDDRQCGRKNAEESDTYGSPSLFQIEPEAEKQDGIPKFLWQGAIS